MRPSIPGAPLPIVKPPIELVVSDVGNIEEEDGARVSIIGPLVVFQARIHGECELAIDITDLLEAIQSYTRQNES